MFYEEKVIDGVLCYRDHPQGEWYRHGPATLTDRVIIAEAEVQRLRDALAVAEVASKS